MTKGFTICKSGKKSQALPHSQFKKEKKNNPTQNPPAMYSVLLIGWLQGAAARQAVPDGSSASWGQVFLRVVKRNKLPCVSRATVRAFE